MTEHFWVLLGDIIPDMVISEVSTKENCFLICLRRKAVVHRPGFSFLLVESSLKTSQAGSTRSTDQLRVVDSYSPSHTFQEMYLLKKMALSVSMGIYSFKVIRICVWRMWTVFLV